MMLESPITERIREKQREANVADEVFAAEIIALIPHLRGFARSLCRSKPDADDLVQETMLKAWQARTRYQPDTNLKAWTFTILRNSFLSCIRRQKIEYGHKDIDDLCTASAPQLGHMELMELKRALVKLPRERREVLMLVGAAGMSYAEAAAICSCAVGTIKSRLSRARMDLQRILDGELAISEGQILSSDAAQLVRHPRRLVARQCRYSSLLATSRRSRGHS